ncbi:hypothetical protein ACFX2I_011400 [Malus domestica]
MISCVSQSSSAVHLSWPPRSYQPPRPSSRIQMKLGRCELCQLISKPKSIEEILEKDIKPRWKKGTKITFPEKGSQEQGLYPAALIFVIDEKPHPLSRGMGMTLWVLMIPVRDIIKPGHEEVVANEIMPISNDPVKKGNLRIKFDVVFPAKLSAEQKDGLRRVLGGGDT